MSDLTFLDLDTLKEGDIVGVTYDIAIGFNRFYSHKHVVKGVIKRITPKRTKFVISDTHYTDTHYTYIELKGRCVAWDEKAIRENELACEYLETGSKINRLKMARDKNGYNLLSLAKLEDEDLIKISSLVDYLYNKYLVEEEHDS